MANSDPSRTEKPTSKRLSDVRGEGRVLSSPDILSLVVILAGTLLLFFTVPQTLDAFRDIMKEICAADNRRSWDNDTIFRTSIESALIVTKVLLPVCFVIMLAAIICMRAQIGSYFSWGALKWKFDFNPKAGLMELIPNKSNLIKLMLTGAKVMVIGYFVYQIVRQDFDEMLMLIEKPLPDAVRWILEHSYILVFKFLGIMLVISALDYVHRKHEYMDSLMMTKQEVKDEAKNSEGDPQIKAKIKRRMRELFFMRMMTNVHKADVVITNPTHVAVALCYEAGSMAPTVVAKGLRKRAEKIKSIAKEFKIPIVEAPPLARSLYRNVKVGQFISEQFYSAVAAILAKLHKQKKLKKQSVLQKSAQILRKRKHVVK